MFQEIGPITTCFLDGSGMFFSTKQSLWLLRHYGGTSFDTTAWITVLSVEMQCRTLVSTLENLGTTLESLL